MYSLINKEVRRGGYIKGVKGKGMKEKRERYILYLAHLHHLPTNIIWF